MKNEDTEKTIIGRAERIDFPKQEIFGVPAKIDTGADFSAIWAGDITVTPDKRLEFHLFGPGSPFYTAEKLICEPGDYEVTRVANSFGTHEFRYKIKLTVRVKGRLVSGKFTLADRSTKTYPVLLGRSMMKGKFLVDVKAGQPLTQQEREKKARLQEDLRKLGETD